VQKQSFFLGIDQKIFQRFAGIAQYREYQPGETIIKAE